MGDQVLNIFSSMLVRPIKKRKFALSELVGEITKDVED